MDVLVSSADDVRGVAKAWASRIQRGFLRAPRGRATPQTSMRPHMSDSFGRSGGPAHKNLQRTIGYVVAIGDEKRRRRQGAVANAAGGFMAVLRRSATSLNYEMSQVAGSQRHALRGLLRFVRAGRAIRPPKKQEGAVEEVTQADEASDTARLMAALAYLQLHRVPKDMSTAADRKPQLNVQLPCVVNAQGRSSKAAQAWAEPFGRLDIKRGHPQAAGYRKTRPPPATRPPVDIPSVQSHHHPRRLQHHHHKTFRGGAIRASIDVSASSWRGSRHAGRLHIARGNGQAAMPSAVDFPAGVSRHHLHRHHQAFNGHIVRAAPDMVAPSQRSAGIVILDVDRTTGTSPADPNADELCHTIDTMRRTRLAVEAISRRVAAMVREQEAVASELVRMAQLPCLSLLPHTSDFDDITDSAIEMHPNGDLVYQAAPVDGEPPTGNHRIQLGNLELRWPTWSPSTSGQPSKSSPQPSHSHPLRDNNGGNSATPSASGPHAPILRRPYRGTLSPSDALEQAAANNSPGPQLLADTTPAASTMATDNLPDTPSMESDQPLLSMDDLAAHMVSSRRHITSAGNGPNTYPSSLLEDSASAGAVGVSKPEESQEILALGAHNGEADEFSSPVPDPVNSDRWRSSTPQLEHQEADNGGDGFCGLVPALTRQTDGTRLETGGDLPKLLSVMTSPTPLKVDAEHAPAAIFHPTGKSISLPGTVPAENSQCHSQHTTTGASVPRSDDMESSAPVPGLPELPELDSVDVDPATDASPQPENVAWAKPAGAAKQPKPNARRRPKIASSAARS